MPSRPSRPRPAPSPARTTKQAVGAPALQPSVADLRALAHPLRLRMMELFAESPRTTKQVAALLGVPPTRLYHHTAALERAGLIVVKETRQRRGAVEKLYAGVEQVLHARGTTAPKRGGRAARRALAATVLEQAKREMLAIPAGAHDVSLLARLVVVVPPKAIPELRRRLYAAIESLRAEYGQADGRDSAPSGDEDEATRARWAVTLAFAPVWPDG